MFKVVELTAKQQKAEYDKLYRAKNKDKIKARNKIYNESPTGREMQKRNRQKKGQEYQNAFCRKPEQRAKERIRRHIRENKIGNKFCISCEQTKPILEFEAYTVFPDKRLYQCRDCEQKQKETLGCTTRGVMTAMRMRSVKMNGTLTRKDIAKYPYLIEANKYLILLKQLVK